jgi:hypothetical protein
VPHKGRVTVTNKFGREIGWFAAVQDAAGWIRVWAPDHELKRWVDVRPRIFEECGWDYETANVLFQRDTEFTPFNLDSFSIEMPR